MNGLYWGMWVIQFKDEHFYLFSFIKALYIKLVKTSKYGRNISRFS